MIVSLSGARNENARKIARKKMMMGQIKNLASETRRKVKRKIRRSVVSVEAVLMRRM